MSRTSMFNEVTFREVTFLPDDRRSISRNVASLNKLAHDVINLLYYERRNFSLVSASHWLLFTNH